MILKRIYSEPKPEVDSILAYRHFLARLSRKHLTYSTTSNASSISLAPYENKT